MQQGLYSSLSLTATRTRSRLLHMAWFCDLWLLIILASEVNYPLTSAELRRQRDMCWGW